MDVKANKLTRGLAVALLLLSVSVVKADSEYPASDYQPKILYQDDSSNQSTSSNSVNTSDSKYPAANFKPEVLFRDMDYKNVATVTSTATFEKENNTDYKNVAAVTSTVIVEKENNNESSLGGFLGLLAVGIAGFMLYKKGNMVIPTKRRKSAGASVTTNRGAQGLSGVAKYLLDNKIGNLASGVAKYLREKENVSSSGVTKYVARQKVSTRLADRGK